MPGPTVDPFGLQAAPSDRAVRPAGGDEVVGTAPRGGLSAVATAAAPSGPELGGNRRPGGAGELAHVAGTGPL